MEESQNRFQQEARHGRCIHSSSKTKDPEGVDTALGVASKQMARAVGNNLAQLDADSLDALKNAIRDHDDNPGPNAI